MCDETSQDSLAEFRVLSDLSLCLFGGVLTARPARLLHFRLRFIDRRFLFLVLVVDLIQLLFTRKSQCVHFNHLLTTIYLRLNTLNKVSNLFLPSGVFRIFLTIFLPVSFNWASVPASFTSMPIFSSRMGLNRKYLSGDKKSCNKASTSSVSVVLAMMREVSWSHPMPMLWVVCWL